MQLCTKRAPCVGAPHRALQGFGAHGRWLARETEGSNTPHRSFKSAAAASRLAHIIYNGSSTKDCRITALHVGQKQHTEMGGFVSILGTLLLRPGQWALGILFKNFPYMHTFTDVHRLTPGGKRCSCDLIHDYFTLE